MGTAAKPDPGTAPAQPAGGTTPSVTGTGGAPADAATSSVPEKYELKLADNSPLDAPFVERFSATAKELKLPQESAAKAFEFLQKEFTDRITARDAAEQKGGAAYETRVADWARQAQNDKEIGGLNFQANLALAQRTAATFFGPEVHEWLENTGFGSHPAIMRALIKIGKALGEDKLVAASGGTADAPRKKSQSEIMYPDHYKEGASS